MGEYGDKLKGCGVPSALNQLLGGDAGDGINVPQLTTAQRDALASPKTACLIYNSTTNKLNFYNGSAWEAVTSA